MNILRKVVWQSLKKNKTRTLVTILGIVLSVSMFSAVTLSVSSLRGFLIDVEVSTSGAWQGAVLGADEETAAALKSEPEVQAAVELQNLGYADIGSKNEYKPYLMVNAVQGALSDLLAVQLTEGRLPETAGELLLPRHLVTNGSVSVSVGDTLELELGDRQSDGETLDQGTAFSEGETLVPRESRTYTVVGFYQRPNFENYSAPGYTALTVADGTGAKNYDVYVALHRIWDVEEVLQRTPYSELRTNVHDDLLRFMGHSVTDGFNSVLYSLCAVLMGIILFGSVSLIYNAFSISVSERTKQFGLLKSIGATNRQIRGSVRYEALVLCAAGIPLGLLAGMGGMGITFRCLGPTLSEFLSNAESGVSLKLHVSVLALVAAAVVSLCTVLISAWIPARRAVKLSAIDAIRQTADINIRAKKVKAPRWIYRVFGFEGMLADKNFRRNKRKCRATVVSLFLSVVLFISASSFCSYLNDSIRMVDNSAGFDLQYTLWNHDANGRSAAEIKELINGCANVSSTDYFYDNSFEAAMEADMLRREFREDVARIFGEERLPTNEQGQLRWMTRTVFLEDAAFAAYLEKQSLDPSVYLNPEAPLAVVFDEARLWNGAEEKYYVGRQLANDSGTLEIVVTRDEIDGAQYGGIEAQEDGSERYVYFNPDGSHRLYTAEEAQRRISCSYGTTVDTVPDAVDTQDVTVQLILLYPESALPAVMGEEKNTTAFFRIYSDAPAAAEESVSKALNQAGLETGTLYNYASMVESARAMTLVVRVFSYGFIILISLIAVANVFNTISTNIHLRQREFAMLRTVGLTQRSFRRMMDFECLLYGAKGLLYGLPAAVGVTWLIYRSVGGGLEMSFYVPWYSVAIAVGSVFAVVFATMFYATGKLKKDNPIDALKNENL